MSQIRTQVDYLRNPPPHKRNILSLFLLFSYYRCLNYIYLICYYICVLLISRFSFTTVFQSSSECKVKLHCNVRLSYTTFSFIFLWLQIAYLLKMVLLLISSCVLFAIFSVFLVFILIFYEWRSVTCRRKCRSLPSPRQTPVFGIGLEIASVKHEGKFKNTKLNFLQT